jgi:hypothetical protein
VVRSVEKELADGVSLYKNVYHLTADNHQVEVHVVEANPALASIEAGTATGLPETPSTASTYAQLQAFEKATGKKVYAISNADYFGGPTPCNAFVKDGIIVKDSINDNGSYDYTNENADLPASKPMLFGFSAGVGKIASIVLNKDEETTVKSKLRYRLYAYHAGSRKLFDSIDLNTYTSRTAGKADFILSNAHAVDVVAGETAYEIKPHGDASVIHGEITEKIAVTSAGTLKAKAGDYLAVFPSSAGKLPYEVGDVMAYAVTSPDNSWLGYQTILGARHEILRDGEIVDTVAKEYMNGTQREGLPRTSIGIKKDGTICLFSVEGLRYGSYSSSDTDPYGLSLVQLADFMRYYGIVNGANFDGGGSSELIINDGKNGTGSNKIVTRSSDYGSYDLSKGRPVVNTIVFTSKS